MLSPLKPVKPNWYVKITAEKIDLYSVDWMKPPSM